MWFSNLVISWLDLQGRFLNDTVFFVFKCLDDPSSLFQKCMNERPSDLITLYLL